MGRLFVAWVCVHCTLIFLYRLLSTWLPSSTLWTTVSVSAWTSLMWVLSLPTFLLSVAVVLRCNGVTTFYSSWEKAVAWASLKLLFVSGIPLLFLTVLHSHHTEIPPHRMQSMCWAFAWEKPLFTFTSSVYVIFPFWRTVICLWLLPHLSLKEEPPLCFRAKWPSAWSVPQSQVAVGGQFHALSLSCFLHSKTVVPFCLIARVSLDGGNAFVVP